MPFASPLESSLFGFIAGLPMHPLVVHAAVVLLPLSAIALIVLVFVPKWRATFGWLTVAGLAVGTAAAFVAKESGEALAAEVGLPADHALWGDILVPVSVALFIVGAGWLWLANRGARAARATSGSILVTVTGVLAAVLAVAAIAITVMVGHSGAEAVWAGQFTTEPSATTTAGAKSYSLDDVKAHSTAADCWSAINGTVYDFTKWEGRHPGGQKDIVNLCGTDGTAAYTGQHGNQKKPMAALAEFAIGTLSGSPSATGAPASPTPKPSSTVESYSIAQVKQHASASSCWSVVDGKVYDLTRWIDRHPGGRARILAMCGTDGTAAFHGEHGNQRAANNDLKGYEIGPLA